VSGAAAGQEIVQPLAVVVLGGLVTSTLLNLFVVPSLYLRFAPAAGPVPESEDVVVVPEAERVAR
jgi:Cu/Ag efflux pump CusA